MSVLFAVAVGGGCDPEGSETAAFDAEAEDFRRGAPRPPKPIVVPDDPLTPPPRVAVLPVFVVPSDQSLPDLEVASDNFGVHLQIARRKYASMLARDGLQRASFRLASWNDSDHLAYPVSAYTDAVAPIVVHVDETTAQVTAQAGVGSYDFMATVLDAVGCHQASCPFVFAVSAVGNPFGGAGGRKLNHGLNNGGGMVLFNYDDGPRGVSEATTTLTFQSTLLHELGHAFGLPHIDAVCGAACGPNHASTTSPSVMSQSLANHITGCGYPNPSGAPCVYPGDAAVDAMPGTLLAEDIIRLSHNDRAFAGLDWIVAVDGGVQYRGSAVQNTDIAAHQTITLTDEFADYAAVLIGDKGAPMLEQHEPLHGSRAWTASGTPYSWTTIAVQLPDVVDLRRVDVYSGHSGVEGRMRGARLRHDGVVLDETSSQLGLDNVALEVAGGVMGDVFEIDVQIHGSGSVTLRALRFFAERDGATVELFPASEPRVVAKTTGTYGGDLGAIVGSLQTVRGYAHDYDPSTSWHSTQVTPGSWMSVDVAFSEPVELGSVLVHTGHSGYYHAARGVQIERQCICTPTLLGTLDDCGPAGATKCAAGAGLVFEHVATTASGPDQTVSFPPRLARRWRIAMRTPSTAEQAATPGYITVRGLRFFTPAGDELAPARTVQ